MATIEHVDFADELVKSTRTFGLGAEAGMPGAQVIALQISELPLICCDDELRHVRMLEVATHEFELFARVMPPLANMRCREPAFDRWQVGCRHRTKRVGRHAQPPSVSIVTLRLV